MRRYFLTGCTGFVGREIVRQLGRRPDTDLIFCLTRSAQARYEMYSWPKVHLWEGDITTTGFPTSFGITDLIHGANEANDLLQPDRHAYYYTIVEGTRRILDWASHEQSIQRKLLLSSGAAARDTIYGKAKQMSEWLCARWNPVPTIARIYAVLGEEMPLLGQYAIGQFVGQAVKDGRIRYWGGASCRSYIHVEDCARWLLTILDNGTPMMPYDVAGEEIVTMEDLAKRVGEWFGVPVEKVEGGEGRPPDLYIPDLRRAHSLGLTQQLTLNDSLRRLSAHFRNPNL